MSPGGLLQHHVLGCVLRKAKGPNNSLKAFSMRAAILKVGVKLQMSDRTATHSPSESPSETQ